ncbi:hypothetical protein Ancab_033872 [Ancistrocladus abbreviatus]
MAAPYAAAARSLLRSSASVRTTASRLANASKPKSKPSTKSPFHQFRTQNCLSDRRMLRRSPVELSCCVESMLPYHTATASALLTSMLSVTPRHYGWTPEDCNDDL